MEIIGQEDRYLDKIVLHNGSIIYGVAEQNDESLTMFLTAQDSISVPISRIKSIKTNQLNPARYLERLEGTYYQVSVGVMLGKTHQNSESNGSFFTSFTSGYKFKPSFGIGLGVGINYYQYQKHVPFYLDVQGDLLENRVTPFYQLSAGWSWADSREETLQDVRVEGGFFLQPSVGVRWHFAKHSWHLKFSYVRQNSTTRFEPIDFGNGNRLTNVEDRTIQRFGISTGISF